MRSDWVRRMCLVLALMLIVGCFAGCGAQKPDAAQPGTTGSTEPADLLQGDLVGCTFGAMTFYLHDGFVIRSSDDSSVTYALGDIQVQVSVFPAGELDEGITSSEAFARYYLDRGSFQTGQSGGIHYLIGREDGKTTVTGLYAAGGMLGTIRITTGSYEKYEADLLRYATLGVLSYAEEPDELVEKRYDRLIFYVGGDFESVDMGDDSACYVAPGMTITARTRPLSQLEGDITGVGQLVQYYVNQWQEEYGITAQTGRYNGVDYLVIEMGSTVMITGLYLGRDTVGILEVAIEDQDSMGELAIEYATMARLDLDAEISGPEPVEYSLTGLWFWLDSSYQAGNSGDNFANYHNGKTTVSVSWEPLPEELGDAEACAREYEQSQQGRWPSVLRDSRGGVDYVICADGQGQYLAVGFYASGGMVGKLVAECTGSLSDNEKLIGIVTGGRVVASEVPGPEVSPPEGVQTVSFGDLMLQISKAYLVTEDANSVSCTSGSTTIMICYDQLSSYPQNISTPAAIASHNAGLYQGVWDHVEVEGSCIRMWDEDGRSRILVYYMKGTTLWEVSAGGVFSGEELLQMCQLLSNAQIYQPEPDFYTIRVVDEGGQPVAGAMIRLISGTITYPNAITGADGTLRVDSQIGRDLEKILLLLLPDSYTMENSQTEIVPAEGQTEFTFVVHQKMNNTSPDGEVLFCISTMRKA